MEKLIPAHKLDWTQRQLDRILDEPDYHGPSRHFRNPLGEPLYDAARVRVARARCGRKVRPPLSPAEVEEWNYAYRPTCAPVLTFNFHDLANSYSPGIQTQGLRLHYRGMSSTPDLQYEMRLIEKALMVLIEAAEGTPPATWAQARARLEARGPEARKRLGAPWPQVILRAAQRRSYISRGTGPKTLNRALDALSLVWLGEVALPWEERPKNLAEVLVRAPVLRFDPIMPTAQRGIP